MDEKEKMDLKIRLFDIIAREYDTIEDWSDVAEEVNAVFDELSTHLF